jgi:hypothetical protein
MLGNELQGNSKPWKIKASPGDRHNALEDAFSLSV